MHNSQIFFTVAWQGTVLWTMLTLSALVINIFMPRLNHNWAKYNCITQIVVWAFEKQQKCRYVPDLWQHGVFHGHSSQLMRRCLDQFRRILSDPWLNPEPWPLLTSADLCWPLLTSVYFCWPLLTSGDLCVLPAVGTGITNVVRDNRGAQAATAASQLQGGGGFSFGTNQVTSTSQVRPTQLSPGWKPGVVGTYFVTFIHNPRLFEPSFPTPAIPEKSKLPKFMYKPFVTKMNEFNIHKHVSDRITLVEIGPSIWRHDIHHWLKIQWKCP